MLQLKAPALPMLLVQWWSAAGWAARGCAASASHRTRRIAVRALAWMAMIDAIDGGAFDLVRFCKSTGGQPQMFHTQSEDPRRPALPRRQG